MVTTSNRAQRIAELEELAREENLVLPMAPIWIAIFEEGGAVVDLRTGKVILSDDSERAWATWLGWRYGKGI